VAASVIINSDDFDGFDDDLLELEATINNLSSKRHTGPPPPAAPDPSPGPDAHQDMDSATRQTPPPPPPPPPAPALAPPTTAFDEFDMYDDIFDDDELLAGLEQRSTAATTQGTVASAPPTAIKSSAPAENSGAIKPGPNGRVMPSATLLDDMFDDMFDDDFGADIDFAAVEKAAAQSLSRAAAARTGVPVRVTGAENLGERPRVLTDMADTRKNVVANYERRVLGGHVGGDQYRRAR
jgi:hypothetical protein